MNRISAELVGDFGTAFPSSYLTRVTRSSAVCPLDGRPMSVVMIVSLDCKKNGAAHDFGRIVRCECGYGHVHPLPEASQVPDFYKVLKYYTHGESHIASLEDGFLDRVRVKIAWHLDRSENLTPEWMMQHAAPGARTACDIGCGFGDMAVAMADLGLSVTAVEPDPAAVLAKGREKLTLVAATAESIPQELQRGQFDLVWMSHVLEHCIDPLAALKIAARMTRGRFICEVPNNACAAAHQAGAAWENLDVPRHLHFFTPDTLALFCTRAGFRVVSTHYAQYTRQFTASWIANERRIHAMFADKPERPEPYPVANSRARAWALLLKTIGAPDARKYDSVRVVCEPLLS